MSLLRLTASKENVTRFQLFGLQGIIGARALAGRVGLSDAQNRVWNGTANPYRSYSTAAQLAKRRRRATG
jgi:hypothetical protein